MWFQCLLGGLVYIRALSPSLHRKLSCSLGLKNMFSRFFSLLRPQNQHLAHFCWLSWLNSIPEYLTYRELIFGPNIWLGSLLDPRQDLEVQPWQFLLFWLVCNEQTPSVEFFFFFNLFLQGGERLVWKRHCYLSSKQFMRLKHCVLGPDCVCPMAVGACPTSDAFRPMATCKHTAAAAHRVRSPTSPQQRKPPFIGPTTQTHSSDS